MGTAQERRFSVAEINRVVEAYVEAVANELPAGQLLEPRRTRATADSRLSRLVDLKRFGSPLRLCTPRQALALVLAVMGRAAEAEVHESSLHLRLVVGMKPRDLRTHEIADRLGLKLSQAQREITMARHMVAAALEENSRTRSRARAA